MELSKKKEKELMQVYEAYWTEYLNGNVDAMQTLLDDSYTQIGSAESEVFASKKEAVQFLVDTINQVAGKLEMRNRSTKVEQQDHLILIHELCDLYALADKKWVFYSKFRASTLLQEKKEGWKITHQHSSFPDTKTEAGQNVAIEKIAEENKELREAVKRRTVELEQKNRELQIEAALERVRARTMAMHKSDELKEVIQVVYEQFVHLNINIEHAGFIMDYKARDDMHIWLTDQREVPSEVTIPYFDTAHWNSFKEAKKEGLDFFSNKLDFKEKNRFYKALFKLIPGVPDETIDHYLKVPGLAISTVLLDDVGLYIENFDGIPYTDNENKILMRFGKVFQQTYTRFLDLKKAEKQAREAQIELALERIRARTMAMHKSEELGDISFELFKQVQALGVATWHCAFNIYDKDQNSSTEWGSNARGTYPMYKTPREGIFLRYYEIGQTKETFHIEVIGEDKCVDHYKWLCTLPGVGEQLLKLKDSGVSFPTSQIDHVAYFKYGYLLFITYEPMTEAHDIFMRFAKVFEQTYTRFLDLKKAEKQAREARIEAALERVRARAMAMHKSEELAEAAELLYLQLKDLGIDPWTCGYVFVEEENNEARVWMVEPNGKFFWGSWTVPLSEEKVLKERHKSWKRKEKIHRRLLKGQENIDHHRYIVEHSPTTPDEAKKFLSTVPVDLVFTSLHFSHGYLMVISESFLSEEEESVLLRFTQVFELTYTRFLDLQKAEAQARESQIEVALERVRSKTMAMHNSEDLEDIVISLFDEVLNLGLEKSIRCGIGILEGHEGMETRSVNSNSDGTVELRVGMLNMNIHPMLVGLKKAWKNGSKGYSYEYTGKDVRKYYEALNNEPEYPFNANLETLPEREFHRSFFFSSGIIFTFSEAPISEESSKILARFAAVFGQTYRRFLDLQKAEAQAREAQIEAALERVRSKSMAMHESKEMLAVIGVVSEQLQQLNLNFDTVSFAKNNQEGDVTFWITSRGQPKPILMEVPTLDSPVLKGIYKAQKKGIPFLADVFSAEINREWHEHLIKYSDLKLFPDKIKDFILNAPGFARSSFLLKNIDLYVGNYRAIPFTDEENSIFRRFAHVFEQSYTRFLDLQKAEAQAREAQIEAALEKVRSRTMAMHKSEELAETALVLYEQFSVLGNIPDRMSIGIFKEETKEIELWPTDQSGSLVNQNFTGSWEKSAIWTKMYEAWKAENDSFVADISGQKLKTWLKFIREEIKLFVDDSHIKGRRVQQAAFFSHGMLLFTTNEPVAEEIMQLLIRFARVFSQTYTRFLDLQKAEAQTREAQIENTLEKVRSRTMAMQKSEELPEAANNLFLQVQALGIPAWSAGYCIWETKDKKTASCNMSSEGEIQKSFILPTIGEGYNFYDPLQKGETFYVEELGGDALVKHYAFMRTLPTVGEIFDELIAAGLSLPTFQIFHIVYFPQGYLMFITYEQVTDAHEIFKRFAKVFEQTYTRFLDLKKAEAQAREAIKQASLDRVRGQIASMRTAADLERITPLLWNELTTMNVPFIRCGVFIIDEPTKIVQVYLSAPDGHSLGVLHLQFNADPLTANTVAHWRKGRIFKEHWNREEFISWTQSLIEQGQISDKNTYQGAANPPESLNLHFIPFTQGMLYVGSENPLNVEQIELVQSLADAFAIAYARYEDFTKLEKAKQSVETTLSDLKTTQNQLVQSEKMASLGELTAGIAHEIQNPLNFVNNFSEVSKELLEEMMEEMEKGDVEEVKALACDIIQNLEKINHHGKRADGIVKGMLQHSRTSSGETEPTDINVLADEYLRLAYHGLRAKDKSFNATMKTDFDTSIKTIEIIPQDMGRVILNLLTNAFHAVKEKQQQSPEGYKPEVSISTKKNADKLSIEVSDNGNGIPKKVIDKIFQPFFTTKPTGEGTGLGLSMSYDIVKAHGGELKVETKEGKGTTFIIQLPTL